MSEEYSLPPYRSRFFHHMKGWERFERLGEHIYLPRNHYIVSPGEKAKYCYLVMEGRVISLELTREGTEHIFNVFEEGSIFLESNVLANYEVDVYFQTIAPTELVRITAQTLREEMLRDPEVMQMVFDSFASKYYSAMDQLRENYNHDALWKVYNMMLLLADGIGKPYYGDWIMIDMKITQQMIGSMLGMNRITVSRVLKELREKEMLLLINTAYYCIRRQDLQEREKPGEE